MTERLPATFSVFVSFCPTFIPTLKISVTGLKLEAI